MTLAGELRIELGAGRSPRIVSTRPDAAKVLLGKTAEQVLATVPLVFTLCGNAQSLAASLACRAALGLGAETKADSDLRMVVVLESLREHCWRILLDWPALVGRPPDKAALAALMALDRQYKSALLDDAEAVNAASGLPGNRFAVDRIRAELLTLLDQAVFGENLTGWRQLASEADLLAWLVGQDCIAAAAIGALYRWDWLALGSTEPAWLPELASGDWFEYLAARDLDRFGREPDWQGVCCESTPLSRQRRHPLLAELLARYGNGLLARFVAVLTEVAKLVDYVAAGEPPPQMASAFGANAGGLARVEAARGLLMHRVEFTAGRVVDYRVIAPTEWNCRPGAVLAQGLRALTALDPENLRRQAAWWLQAIDPCVPYRLALDET
ncbi:nickel-dependent hydrogenase large subunit [Methylomonas sp. HW2-6]|uniref:nickel-dependent hydrogenase large subunit n=1 Tax=Methylomonas TaxID=416 RepID=UPI00112D7320|nr:nickel-dependent hydrogenase large subunit [Methylomonas koyamae]TPQ28233.1 Ni,Fe-hydrogenase I large subunit [Methylomonas koyamae]